jgi:hypothetical protein
METIRNYLENMFMSLPNTPEVCRAKDELWQMMEDKYTELKAEGKSENEAVGTVISEFGNLDEIAKDLGIDNVVTGQQSSQNVFTFEMAKNYIADFSRRNNLIGIGVMLCILSIAAPIFGDAFGSLNVSYRTLFEAVGACLMFVIIAVAVGIFIYANISVSNWKFLKTAPYTTDFAATSYISERMAQYKPTYALTLVIGIALCIISVVPPIIVDAIPAANSGFADDFGGGLMFILVAVGVFLIVSSVLNMGIYEKLLAANDAGTVAGNFVPEQKSGKTHKAGKVALVILGIVVLFAAVNSVLSIFLNKTSKITGGVLDTFDKIYVDTNVIDISIVSGDSYSYSLSTSKNLNTTVEVNDGTLRVSQTGYNSFFNFGFGFNASCKVTIVVPDGVEISVIDITSDVGDINISGIGATRATIDTNVGDVDLSSMTFKQMNISADVGDIKLSGIAGISDCNVDISTDLGSISFMGTSRGTSFSRTGNTDTSLTITTDVGSVKISN